MSNAKNIIEGIRGDMRGRWNGANGNGGNRFKNVYGNGLSNSPGTPTNRPQGWSANGSSNAMPAGSPKYIIQLSNASNVNYNGGFDIFGASIYLNGFMGGGTWDINGNFTKNGITVSCVFGTVTYQQMLAQSMSNPFTSGGVYLEAIAGLPGQVSQIYTLTSQDSGGQLYSVPVKPYIDPKQFQNNITYNTSAFNIDGLTKITWNTIYANSVFQISIFPSSVVNPTQSLNQGGNVMGNFGKPKVTANLS